MTYLENKAQKHFLEEKLKAYSSINEEFSFLHEKLSSEEKDSILCPNHETQESLNLLLKEGQFFGSTDIIEKGTPCQCHSNVALFYEMALSVYGEDQKIYKIVTGYALSKDLIWRQHSWILKNDSEIVETTEPRIRYFGVILTDKNLKVFIEENI